VLSLVGKKKDTRELQASCETAVRDEGDDLVLLLSTMKVTQYSTLVQVEVSLILVNQIAAVSGSY
jgi:uncharacterized membrane protein